jgi:heptose I phosphotransferase
VIWIAGDLADWLDAGDDDETFRRVFAIDGEIFREPPGAGRRTLRFEHAGVGYFLKLHWGVGWQEIVKNLLALKRPVLGARNEWLAIQRLETLGVETMQLAGFGERGANPARRQSFVITRELADTVSLEDHCADWVQHPPPFAHKQALIDRVADMTSALHRNGLNHRDLYLCHFLLQQPWHAPDDPLHLFLIDLHRMQQRAAVPHRWRLKDLAALYFSALHIGLTRRDLLRFIARYSGSELRVALRDQAALWTAVERRALRLQQRRPVVPPESADG